MSWNLKTSIFDRQETLPPSAARRLSYDTGFVLGLAAGPFGDDWLQGMLLDARVLSQRHGSVAVAARLMHVSVAGLRGFLDGADYKPSAKAEPLLVEAA
jgi:hypothetical protein